MKLCEKLYELRRAAGLSQEELAERLNVSRQAVSKWENGAAQPELSKLVELSRLYGVSVDELLSLEEAEKGDAKAASSVDSSTPAPAQDTLAAPKKVRRQKLLLGAAMLLRALPGMILQMLLLGSNIAPGAATNGSALLGLLSMYLPYLAVYALAIVGGLLLARWLKKRKEAHDDL